MIESIGNIVRDPAFLAILNILVLFCTWLVKQQVTKVHYEINSKMTQFLELTATSKFAEGKLAEKTETEQKEK